MCLSPITIKNPYFGIGKIGINSFHNTIDSHIQVPCGKCPQCTSMRQSFYMQRIQMESLRSHLFMFTLTYNDDSLVYVSVGEYHLAVPVLSDVQNLFKRLRSMGLKFRVSYVSEYGSRRHRPHFHGILAIDKSEGDPRALEKKWSVLLLSQWKRNYATTINKKGDIVPNTRCPSYRPLSTPQYKLARNTTFDLHYIEPVRGHDNDCSFYVSKYITKYDKWTSGLLSKINLDPNLDDGEISFLTSLLKPRCNTSKDFGDWSDPVIRAYINKCASRESLYRYPQFYDIYTGKQMPMSPYYGKHIDGFEHCYERLLASDEVDNMSTNFYKNDSCLDSRQLTDSAFQQFEDFNRKLDKLSKRLSD